MQYAIGIKFVRLLGCSQPFIARFGDLKDSIAVILEFEAVTREFGKIVPFKLFDFNGIQTYVRAQEVIDKFKSKEWQLNDIFEVKWAGLTSSYGVNINGTANLFLQNLTKSSLEQVMEIQEVKKMSSHDFSKLVEMHNKQFKYKTYQRYIGDLSLRSKYEAELLNFDNVYKGPGREYPIVDLKEQFKKNGFFEE